MSQIKDLAGQKFGKLIVISRNEENGNKGNAYWNCKCDCGKIIRVMGSRLNNNRAKACSNICYHGTDLTGQKFGKLLVIEQASKRKKFAYWICKCDCGIVKEIRTDNLRNGDTTSCGCVNKLPEGESVCRWLFNSYRKGAKKRGYCFDLTLEDFKLLTKQECYYCGGVLSNLADKSSSHSNGTYRYNGIDRFDNKIGYTKENSKPCCKICNRLKSNHLNGDDFIKHCSQIFEYQKE